MKVRAKTGKERGRSWTEWRIGAKRSIVVQQAAPGLPWYIFDVHHGPKAPVRTVGYSLKRSTAVVRAKKYIGGLRLS